MRIVEQHGLLYRGRLWIEMGLAIGITLLLRQVFVLFVPFLLLWIWWNLPGLSSRADRSPGIGYVCPL